MSKLKKRDFDAFSRNGSPDNVGVQSLPANNPPSRSCRGCYERKVRCDRLIPCTNCGKLGIACEYPSKVQETTRKTNALQLICSRLERVESLLTHCIEADQRATANTRNTADESRTRGYEPRGGGGQAKPTSSGQMASDRTSPAAWQILLDDEPSARTAYATAVRGSNQTREKTNTSHIKPVQVTSHLTNQLSGHNNSSGPHPTGPHSSNSGFDVLDFYPDTNLALHLWSVYVKSVDPVIKILHIPSIQSTVVSAMLDPKSVPLPILALTYAIYLAAVTALRYNTPDDSDTQCSDQTILLQRLKSRLDRLLLSTELMSCPSLTALQALAIYVTCLRVHEVDRSVWVLNGLAIRLAQSMGLDRDGVALSLSPFETEMRLRLWWYLCILDSRAPEDHGFQPTVDITNRHLRLPLNVNDNQIYPGMTELPVESSSWTEMSFFLMQTDACRILFPMLDVHIRNSKETLADIKEKRNMLATRCHSITKKYGIHPGQQLPHPMCRVAEQHSATARLKMQFMLQLREELATQRPSEPETEPIPEVLRPSFPLACQTLESNRALLQDQLANGFKWFFRMYTQWYALAFVLRCLCSCSSGLDVDRAWALVDELFPAQSGFSSMPVGPDDNRGLVDVRTCLNLLHARASVNRDYKRRAASDILANCNRAHVRKHQASSAVDEDTEALTAGPTADEIHLPHAAEHATAFTSHEISFQFLEQPLHDVAFLPDSDWDAIMGGWTNEDSLFAV